MIEPADCEPMRFPVIGAEVGMLGEQSGDGELEQVVEGGERGQLGVVGEVERAGPTRRHRWPPGATGRVRRLLFDGGKGVGGSARVAR